jgi:hypothetical protein
MNYVGGMRFKGDKRFRRIVIGRLPGYPLIIFSKSAAIASITSSLSRLNIQFHHYFFVHTVGMNFVCIKTIGYD